MTNALSQSIRLAGRRDCAQIATMSRELIEHGLNWRWKPGKILHMVRNPDASVVIAENEAGMTGFAIMVFNESQAHLNLLAVSPDARRQGTGQALVNWLVQSCRVAGIARITLEVRQSNKGAQTFYSQLGFESAGLRRGYYDGREHAVVMRKQLITNELESMRPGT